MSKIVGWWTSVADLEGAEPASLWGDKLTQSLTVMLANARF